MNFKDAKEYIKTNNSIDGFKFEKVTDLTNMLDLLNKEVEEKGLKETEGDVREISKFLVRSLTTKIFI